VTRVYKDRDYRNNKVVVKKVETPKIDVDFAMHMSSV